MRKREIIIVMLLVISLMSLSLYSTMATDVIMNNEVAVDTDLGYTIDITDQTGRKVTVNAGVTKVMDLFMTNKNNETIKYGIGYTSFSTISEDVTIAVANTSKDNVTDIIEKDATKQVTVVVDNQSTNSITITLIPLSGYENGGDLISCQYAGDSWSKDVTNCGEKSWLRYTLSN